MEQNKWHFNTIRDRVVTTVSSTAGLAILGIGLAHFFAPAAVAVAFGYGVYKVGAGTALAIPKFREWAFNSEIKKGHFTPVGADEPALKIASEISVQLGRKEAPKMYTVDAKTVGKLALPFGLRWMMKIDALRREIMPKVFAALPGTNTLIATREGLDQMKDEKKMKFVIAHEMSHLQAKDNLSPTLLAKSLAKQATKILFWGTLAASALAVVGVTLPVVAGTSALWALGGLTAVWAGAKVANNIGMRAIEERADRNALYITRDLESGKNALADIDESSEKPNKVPLYREAFLDHPSFWRRVETMTTAFAKVAAYPELAPAKAPVPVLAPAASSPR